MAGWNDLPKELKWIIFRHLLDECFLHPYRYYKEKWLTCSFSKKIYESCTKTIIKPRYVIPLLFVLYYHGGSIMYMYELLLLLAQIDKMSRKVLQSHCIFSEKTFLIQYD